MDIITTVNRQLVGALPAAAIFFQRAHMKLSAIMKAEREFATVFGARMRGDISDYIFQRIYFFGIWEPALTAFMRNTIRPGTTVLDVGANHGYFTLLMSQLVGGHGRVIAIEASPVIFQSLAAHLVMNGVTNVAAHNIAISSHHGTVELYNPMPSNSGTQTTTPCKAPSISVSCDRLISLIDRAAESISFIKIDIEGAERPALQDILDNRARFSRPFTVVCEISEKNRDMIALFDNGGFECSYIDNGYGIEHYLRPSATLPHPIRPQLPLACDFIFALR